MWLRFLETNKFELKFGLILLSLNLDTWLQMGLLDVRLNLKWDLKFDLNLSLSLSSNRKLKFGLKLKLGFSFECEFEFQSLRDPRQAQEQDVSCRRRGRNFRKFMEKHGREMKNRAVRA